VFDTIGEGQLHLLGTDDQGRDQFTRLLYGGRVSLTIGLISTLVSFTLGCLIGAVSGYFGGWLDSLLMGGVEVIMSIPTLYLLVALTAILPDQMNNAQRFSLIVALLSLVSWAGLARVIRGQVMGIKQETFITAARSTGASHWRIIWRHILPQTSTYIVIAATSSIPGFTIAESVLSLIGLGIRPPDASWGNMLSLATNSSIIVLQPWLIWSPAILIVLTVLAYNLLGDGLRDALDPKHNRP
jgi:peptide/nickel transport system permease protein